MKHVISDADRLKRRGDRRLLALLEIRKRGSATPGDLARKWKVHPTSALRVLERLRRFGNVERDGPHGIRSIYSLDGNGRGLARLAWLRKKFPAS